MEAPLDPDDAARFRDLVRERVGLAFPQSRLADVAWAVRKAVADTGLPDAGALFRQLVRQARPHDSLDALVSALNVSETHFFRDHGQIEALERRILPDIVARRRRERRLRIWSAGCSTGEEAYTLAILVHKQLDDLAEWDVRILATDLNGRSLDLARQGVYGRWSFRGVPPQVRETYFVPDGERYRLAPQLRAMVTFEQLNLVDPAPLPLSADPWKADLILCRNVLLYFDADTARAVVGRLGGCLDEQGWLLLSQLEAAKLGGFDGFERDPHGGGADRRAHPVPAGDAPAAPGGRAEAREAPVRAALRPPAPVPASGAAVAPPAPAPADPAEVPPGYGEALRLWREHHPRHALRLLQVEGSHDQLTAPLHYLQGLILLDGGRAEQAMAAFRRCTFADPHFALGYLAQAGLFTRTGNPGRARAALENAARLVAHLDREARVFPGDELRAGALLELVDAQRRLLGAPARTEAVDA
jgi:chemotaxis protein methyltransferase CheR